MMEIDINKLRQRYEYLSCRGFKAVERAKFARVGFFVALSLMFFSIFFIEGSDFWRTYAVGLFIYGTSYLIMRNASKCLSSINEEMSILIGIIEKIK